MGAGRETGAGGGGCDWATSGSALSFVTSTSWSAFREEAGGVGMGRSLGGGEADGGGAAGGGGVAGANVAAGGAVEAGGDEEAGGAVETGADEEAGGAVEAGGNVEALSGGGSSIVAIATRDRILQRRSTDAFTRYSMTSSSMMTGRATFEMGNAGGFGRIGTTAALEAGGTGVAVRGVNGFGAAMVLGTEHASFPRISVESGGRRSDQRSRSARHGTRVTGSSPDQENPRSGPRSIH
jgi:hypothetical protein